MSPNPTDDLDECDVTGPRSATVYHQVLHRAANQPSDIAVESHDRQIRYGELPALVDRIAAGLHRCGVRHGDAVSAYCRTTADLPALVLGIWRCGAIYVPLDPKYPSQRLRAIVQDVSPRLIVCDKPASSAIELDGRLICDLTTLVQGRPDPELLAALEPPSPDDRAVVLYTSGSTGTPKGAILSHRNLANHHAFVVRAFGLGPDDRRTAVCSINFDASLEEFFCTLTSGATLVLPETDTLDSLDRFLKFLERRRITSLFMPTSLWRETTNFLHAERREYPATLRLIDIGGERVTRPMYERFLQVGGRRMRWVNVYGPTECSIYATIYEHDPLRDAESADAPPIGRPIDGVQLYVVGEDGRLCAADEPGELYLGGVCVGLGYWNNLERTAERFVERPTPEMPPGRYYRTGDQVRFRPDGELEYVGRLDDQIKLRGFRIEPGEIEAVLHRHPSVRDAAVVVHTSQLGTQYLAAHVVAHTDKAWDERSLRELAADLLPDYMVPRRFVREMKLPLSPNGKIDRRALREPSCSESSTDAGDELRKSTELERRIADVWRETLGAKDIGLHDDFFSLGGDSLRALSLASKLEEALGVPVSAALLFIAPTVARMAVELERARHGATTPIIQLRDGHRERPLFFVHSLVGDAWVYRDLVQHLRYSGAVYGLQLPIVDASVTSTDRLETLATDYLRRMRDAQPVGPYRIAGYSSGGMLAYEMARQLTAAGEHVEFLGLIDAGIPPANEAKTAGPNRRRVVNLISQLPETTREFLRRGWGYWSRRAFRFVRGRLPVVGKRNDSTDASASDFDEQFRACFSQDISIFKPDRLRQIKEHYQAVFRYEAGPWRGEADLFRVRRQPLSSVPTRTLGWESLISGAIRVYDVPGTHTTLMESPHAADLATKFDTALAQRTDPAIDSTQTSATLAVAAS